MPISGNAASARTGDITVLVSGPERLWREVKPVVATFSNKQVYLGDAEQARYMKLVINAVVVSTAQAMAEALTLGRTAGLDWDLMLETIAQSTIASPWLKAKINLLKSRDFTPTMSPQLILKDMDLMIAAAAAGGASMPFIELTRELWQELLSGRYAQEDYMAAVKLAEERAGLRGEAIGERKTK